MSVRSITIIGLVCLCLSVTLMYMPFVDVYAEAAVEAQATVEGQPIPVSRVSFVSPTELPGERARIVIMSLVFGLGAGGCLVYLARRAALVAPPTNAIEI